MAHFIRDGIYMEGDMIYGGIEVPKRPSINHVWQDGAWVLDVKKEALANIAELEAKVTPRMLREAALGVESSKTMLNDIQVQIEAERLKL